ncbi:MAG: hypothetical protein OXI01_11065 [Albidovulum sp.]|nr:hypothetical protein [Albidovulum sp.]
MDIRTFVVLAAGQEGFHPSKHRPLPGTQNVWEGVRNLWTSVIGHSAMREWMKDNETTD